MSGCEFEQIGKHITSIIIHFFFFVSRNFQTVRSLLTNLNTVAADEMQTLLTLAEHLRSSFENEVERVKQAQKQYDELITRYEDMMKQWSNDKEKIRQQRDEIGKGKSSFHVFLLFELEKGWKN